jgi:hypothetical protein
MFVERRIDPREALALPVRLGDGCSAMTRDISASGMFIEIDGQHALRGLVVFEMHLADAGMKFTAEGEIIRVEHRAGRSGVAVKLRSPRLERI